MIKFSVFALAATLALPAAASNTYHASNGMQVTPVNQNSFVISGIPRNTPQSHWCAAAEFSQRFLDANFSQRMYIVGDAQPGQRQYLVSLNPAGTASEGQRIKEWGVRIDGANRRIDEGLAFCDRFLLFPRF